MSHWYNFQPVFGDKASSLRLNVFLTLTKCFLYCYHRVKLKVGHEEISINQWFAETHIVNIVMSVSVCLYLSVFTLTKSSLTLNANRISCRRFGRGPRILLSLPDPESIFLGCSVPEPPPLRIASWLCHMGTVFMRKRSSRRVFPFRSGRESYTASSEIHLLLSVLIVMLLVTILVCWRANETRAKTNQDKDKVIF